MLIQLLFLFYTITHVGFPITLRGTDFQFVPEPTQYVRPSGPDTRSVHVEEARTSS